MNGEPFSPYETGATSQLLLYRTPSTTYSSQVRVRDVFGNIALSNVPTVPTNLRLGSASSVPEITLFWDQSTDTSDPQSLILYEIFVNGAFSEPAAIGSGRTTTYCVGEGPNTITIRAVDTSGNASGLSNRVVVC